jgi:hypothetical protein
MLRNGTKTRYSWTIFREADPRLRSSTTCLRMQRLSKSKISGCTLHSGRFKCNRWAPTISRMRSNKTYYSSSRSIIIKARKNLIRTLVIPNYILAPTEFNLIKSSSFLCLETTVPPTHKHPCSLMFLET